jgi:hypothetical protein
MARGGSSAPPGMRPELAAARPELVGEQSPVVRRIRDHARDSISAAAFSLTGSVLTTALLWALARWLG